MAGTCEVCGAVSDEIVTCSSCGARICPEHREGVGCEICGGGTVQV